MWALGTIIAELLNLKALFPGQSEIDQCWRMTTVLGDPSPDYGHDERGIRLGGGEWVRGLKLAKNVDYRFPKVILFDQSCQILSWLLLTYISTIESTHCLFIAFLPSGPSDSDRLYQKSLAL